MLCIKLGKNSPAGNDFLKISKNNSSHVFWEKNYMPIKIKIAVGDFLQIVVMQACSAFPLSPRIVFGETDWYIYIYIVCYWPDWRQIERTGV